MRVTTPKIIQPGEPRLIPKLLVALIMLVLLVLAYSRIPFWVTVEGAGSTDQLGELIQEKNLRLEQLMDERVALKTRIAALERSNQVDRESIEQSREEMKKVLAQRLEMEEELAFLKGLVSNGVKKEGLYIQGFKLESTGLESSKHYMFTVSQKLKNVGAVSGWIKIFIEGKQGDKATTLNLEQVLESKEDKVKMRFKHYQKVEGTFVLPGGFTPNSVLIELQPNNSDLSPVKKRFDWLVTYQ